MYMKSPKETYIQMVEELRKTSGYNEFLAVSKKYWSQDMIKTSEELGAPTGSLSDEEMAPSFRFDHATLPTPGMLQDMTEQVFEATAQLVIHHGVRQVVYMVKEDDEWKYDSENILEELRSGM
jgi:hypothetical protein